MEKKRNKVKLYDTYLTDIAPLGAVIALKEEGKEEYFSRSYQKGEVYFRDAVFEAECIQFVSGNVQITDLCGEEDKLDSFLRLHYRRQQSRRPILMLRKFFQYLYILSSFGLGFLTFLCLCRLQFGKLFLGFVMLFVLRLLYSESRNKLK